MAAYLTNSKLNSSVSGGLVQDPQELAFVEWDPPAPARPGEPRLNWRLSQPLPVPETIDIDLAEPTTQWDREKTLAAITQCPNCACPEPLRWHSYSVTCPGCDTQFKRIRSQAVNFITQTSAALAQLKSTEAVSRHTYDVAARALIAAVSKTGGTILDCGAGAHDRWFDNVIRTEIVPYEFTDCLATNQALPFRTGSFDAVFSLNVLEHVNDPWICAKEIIRVLKPGGIAYVVVPFLQPVHGYPDHYYNMTTSGLRRLFQEFGEVELQFIPAAGQPIFSLDWFLRSYLAGLNEQAAERFANLTVKEIVERGAIGMLDEDFVRELSSSVRMELASTTSAFVRKSTA